MALRHAGHGSPATRTDGVDGLRRARPPAATREPPHPLGFGPPRRWRGSGVVPVTQIRRRLSSGTPWTGWPIPPLLRRHGHGGRLLAATSPCCRVCLWWSGGGDLDPPQWVGRRWHTPGTSRTRSNSRSSYFQTRRALTGSPPLQDLTTTRSRFMSKLKQDVFDKAHAKAVATTLSQRPPTQRSYNDLDRIKIYFKPTGLQLLHMYKEIHNLIVKHSSAMVDRDVKFAQPVGGIPSMFKAELLDGVPVALPYDKSNLYYFILEVVTDDDSVFEFPMRLDSMYCCGFCHLRHADDPMEKLWYSFGKVSILPKRLFKERMRSGLSLAYNDFSKIQIYNGVIAKFCHHFEHFQPVHRDRKDPDAQVLKDTMYFILCESSRFWFAMGLSFQGLLSKKAAPIRLTELMGELIQNYGDSSRLGVYLWLGFLERKMALSKRCLHDPTRFPDLLLAFSEEAKDFFRFEPLIKFKASSADWCLGAFVGQSLFIIKYSCVLVRKALMRDAGYERIFPEMTPLTGDDDVNCYDD